MATAPRRGVEHRPVVGRVQRPRPLGARSVRRRSALGSWTVTSSSVISHRTRRRRGTGSGRRVERLLEGREAVGGRDGVAPGHVVGVADQDQRHAEQAGAADVHLARDRELGLVEALRAVPGEVRVGEHHPLAVLGRLRCRGRRRWSRSRRSAAAPSAAPRAPGHRVWVERRATGAGRRLRRADPVDRDAARRRAGRAGRSGGRRRSR